MRSSALVAPRSRAFGFDTSTGPIPVWIGRAGSCPCRTTRGARPAVRDRYAWRGTPRTPPRPPAGPAVSRRTAEFRSEDRQFHLADGEGQLYSRSWRNAPSGGSGRRGANPVTSLKSHCHHPLSRIALRPHAGAGRSPTARASSDRVQEKPASDPPNSFARLRRTFSWTSMSRDA